MYRRTYLSFFDEGQKTLDGAQNIHDEALLATLMHGEWSQGHTPTQPHPLNDGHFPPKGGE